MPRMTWGRVRGCAQAALIIDPARRLPSLDGFGRSSYVTLAVAYSSLRTLVLAEVYNITQHDGRADPPASRDAVGVLAVGLLEDHYASNEKHSLQVLHSLRHTSDVPPLQVAQHGTRTPQVRPPFSAAARRRSTYRTTDIEPQALTSSFHAPPQVEGILQTAGLQLDASSNRALAASLAAVAEAAPESAPLVRALATRAMSEAQYFCLGAGEKLPSPMHPPLQT